MMRAEAAFQLGKTAEALADVNTIRTRSGIEPLSSITLMDIYDERGRELFPIPQPRLDANPNLVQNPGY